MPANIVLAALAAAVLTLFAASRADAAIKPGSLAVGGLHTCVLKADSTPVCWGYNGGGQTNAPALTFTELSSGANGTCGLREDGSVNCWGALTQNFVPQDVQFKQVSLGPNLACGIKSDDTIICFGQQVNIPGGQAGVPSATFKRVSADLNHTCAIRLDDDTLVCWGNGPAPPTGTFKEIDTGAEHSCGIRTDNTMACWGSNGQGQTNVPAGTWLDLATGADNTCGIKTGGTIACWGGNGHEQSAPVPAGTYTEMSAGISHTCAVRGDDGAVLCWGGKNLPDYGYLGGSPTITSAAPVGSVRVGEPYSHTYTTADTGLERRFALTSGALPPGVTLNGSTGQLSGTPTDAGIYTGAVTASNGVFADSTQEFTIVVAKAAVDLRAYGFSKEIGTAANGAAGVSQGYNPTGTLAFSLYGPGDADCSKAPIFGQTLPFTGDPSVVFTDALETLAAGTYRWSVVYSGDSRNEAASVLCTAESDVLKVQSNLALASLGGGEPGSVVRARATLSGGRQPSGEITLSLHGPTDPSCAKAPVYTRTVPVPGNGVFEASFTPSAPGDYRWKAVYSGDEVNAQITQWCSTPVRIADKTAPETTITSKPRKPVKKSAKFSFSADDRAATFECRLDAGAWKPCTSPTTLKRLKPGKHTFSVRARDAAGNTEASPATAAFKVKKKKRKR